MEENLPPLQTPVNPVPVPPVQPPHPKNFPLNLVLTIALVIAIFSVIILSAVKNQPSKQTPSPSTQITPSPTPTPTPNPTANWKTYKNEQYKFQFQYPQNLYLKQSPKFGDQIFLTENDIDINEVNEGPFALVTIAIWDKNKFEKTGYPRQDKYLKSENVTIDGVDALKLSGIIPEGEYLAGSFHQEVSFPIKDKIIHFIFFEDSSNNIKLLDQILSTFKFLRKEAANKALCNIETPNIPPAPIDSQKLIKDPKTGMLVTKDQIILVALESLSFCEVQDLLVKHGGKIVGSIPDLNMFQIQLPEGADLNKTIESFKSDPRVETAYPNTPAEIMNSR